MMSKNREGPYQIVVLDRCGMHIKTVKTISSYIDWLPSSNIGLKAIFESFKVTGG